MKTKFITISSFLIFLIVYSSYSDMPDNYKVTCDPQGAKCFTVHFPNGPDFVKPGTPLGTEFLGASDPTSCGSGVNDITDIFIHDQVVGGDGTGYNDIQGCYNPLTEEVNYWLITGFSSTNSFSTWELNASGN